jgi:hypothetical protein
MPENIILEGLNRSTNQWETLDIIYFKRIYDEAKDDNKINVTINQFWSGVISDDEISKFEDTGKVEPLPLEAYLNTTCDYLSLFEFNKVEQRRASTNIYCPPVTEETLVKFIWPNNCPPYIVSGGKVVEVNNVYWCQPEPDKLIKQICPEPIPVFCPDGYIQYKVGGPDLQLGECPYWTCQKTGITIGDTPIPTEYSIFRTGSNFSLNAGFNDPLNNQENLQLLCGEQVTFQSFKEFRVKLVNFFMAQDKKEIRGGGTAYGPKALLPLYPQNKFYIQNISFIDAFNVPFSGHEGSAECLIGSDYIVSISGLAPLRFTGIYDVYITGGEQESGVYKFENVSIGRKVEDYERPLKFNRVSGYIYEESGFANLNQKIFASGDLCYNFDDTPYFFYDPETTIVTFEKSFCTSGAYRTGIVTGTATVVKSSVVNKELLRGGKYNTPVATYSVIQNSNINGTIFNTPYRAYNITGIYIVTGIATGIAKDGYLDVNINQTRRPFD